MSYIRYKNNNLFVERISVRSLASKLSTPFYLYSEGILLKTIDHFQIILKNPIP